MSETTRTYGWVARQKARIGAVLMGAGAAIHPFDSARALRVLQESFEEEGRDGGD